MPGYTPAALGTPTLPGYTPAAWDTSRDTSGTPLSSQEQLPKADRPESRKVSKSDKGGHSGRPNAVRAPRTAAVTLCAGITLWAQTLLWRLGNTSVLHLRRRTRHASSRILVREQCRVWNKNVERLDSDRVKRAIYSPEVDCGGRSGKPGVPGRREDGKTRIA